MQQSTRVELKRRYRAMVLRRVVVAISAAVVMGVVFYHLVPAHVWRAGGHLDCVIAIDTSGSAAKELPAYKEGSSQLVKALFPDDCLAVIGFDVEARKLYRGRLGSSKVLKVVEQQLRSLSASDQDGTVLPEALALATDSFEHFVRERPSHRSRHRILVLFSDGQATMTQGTSHFVASDEARLPELSTVVAIGFVGIAEDGIVQLLQGNAGNPVHIVSTEESKPAIEATLDAIRRAHPVKWLNIALASLVTVFLSVISAIASEGLLGGRQHQRRGVLMVQPLLKDARPRVLRRPITVGADVAADLPCDDLKETTVRIVPVSNQQVRVENLSGQVSVQSSGGVPQPVKPGESMQVPVGTVLNLEDAYQLRVFESR